MSGHIGYNCRFCGTLTKWDSANKYRNQKLCYKCGALLAKVLYREGGEATQQEEDTVKKMCLENLQCTPKRMVPIVARQRWHLGVKESQGIRCTRCLKSFDTEVKHGLHTKNLCVDCENQMYQDRSETRHTNLLGVAKHIATHDEALARKRELYALHKLKGGKKDAKQP